MEKTYHFKHCEHGHLFYVYCKCICNSNLHFASKIRDVKHVMCSLLAVVYIVIYKQTLLSFSNCSVHLPLLFYTIIVLYSILFECKHQPHHIPYHNCIFQILYAVYNEHDKCMTSWLYLAYFASSPCVNNENPINCISLDRCTFQ